MSALTKRKINPCTITAIIAFLLLGIGSFWNIISCLFHNITNGYPFQESLIAMFSDSALLLITGLLFPVTLLLTTKITQKGTVKSMLFLAIFSVAGQVFLSVIIAIAAVIVVFGNNPLTANLWYQVAFDLTYIPGCCGLRSLLLGCIDFNSVGFLSPFFWAIACGCAFLSTIVCAVGFSLRLKQLKNQDASPKLA